MTGARKKKTGHPWQGTRLKGFDMKSIEPKGRKYNPLTFADRPPHCGGYRAFLPAEVLRHSLCDDKDLFFKDGTPRPRREPLLLYSLANVFPLWAKANGIKKLAEHNYELPKWEFRWWRPQYCNVRLTPNQERLVKEHAYLIDVLIIELTGKKPQPPVVVSFGAEPTKEAAWMADLVSAANEALFDAARLFKPSLGNKFSTYASPTIRHALWRAKNGSKRDAMNLAGRLSIDQPKHNYTDKLLGPDLVGPVPASPMPPEAWDAIEAALSPREFAVLDGRQDGKKKATIGRELGISGTAVANIEKRALKKAELAVNAARDARLAGLAQGFADSEMARALWIKAASTGSPLATAKKVEEERFLEEWAKRKANPVGTPGRPRVSRSNEKYESEIVGRARRHHLALSEIGVDTVPPAYRDTAKAALAAYPLRQREAAEQTVKLRTALWAIVHDGKASTAKQDIKTFGATWTFGHSDNIDQRTKQQAADALLYVPTKRADEVMVLEAVAAVITQFKVPLKSLGVAA